MQQAEASGKKDEQCGVCSNVGCDACKTCRPPALWAREKPGDRYSSSSKPQPHDGAKAMAEAVRVEPHPRLACDCEACDAAPRRPQFESSTVRPIAVGCGTTRLAERCFTTKLKTKFASALMPVQNGGGVPGGMQMGISMIEA